MKKFAVFCLLLIFVTPSFADLDAKKEEYLKVKKYLALLDKKIVEARQKRQINRLAELKDIKRNVIARANSLKAEIEKGEPGSSSAKKPVVKKKTSAVAPAKVKSNYWIGSGYGGAALMLGGGYVNPVLPGMDLVLGLNLGLGNDLTVIDAGVATRFPVADYFLGVELDMVNYSKDVSDVPGLNKIDRGFHAGFGVFGGQSFGQIAAQLGYNTALGLTAKLIYNF